MEPYLGGPSDETDDQSGPQPLDEFEDFLAERAANYIAQAAGRPSGRRQEGEGLTAVHPPATIRLQT
jgi:hypothetical protein